ncbi:MAG: CBS domain-containing protein [Desulfosarcinaceae bacterium]
MKIEDLMMPDPITVTSRAGIHEAIDLMKQNAIRHLPVVNSKNQLVGLLTLADLKQALLPSMLGDLTLADMMIKNPITVSPDDDIEFAARLIYKHKISGLPVLRNRILRGIITESDILRAFIDMMGLLASSVRIDISTDAKPGGLKKAIQIIEEHGGEIINVAMTAQMTTDRNYSFRLCPCDVETIVNALKNKGFAIQGLLT